MEGLYFNNMCGCISRGARCDEVICVARNLETAEFYGSALHSVTWTTAHFVIIGGKLLEVTRVAWCLQFSSERDERGFLLSVLILWILCGGPYM